MSMTSEMWNLRCRRIRIVMKKTYIVYFTLVKYFGSSIKHEKMIPEIDYRNIIK